MESELLRDLVNGLIQKTNNQDKINALVNNRLAEIDKSSAVFQTKTEADLVQLRNDVDSHPVNCPANETKVRHIVHQVLDKRKLDEIVKEKAEEHIPQILKDETKGWAGVVKSVTPIERILILLIVLYFILDKVGVIDSLFNSPVTQ